MRLIKCAFLVKKMNFDVIKMDGTTIKNSVIASLTA